MSLSFAYCVFMLSVSRVCIHLQRHRLDVFFSQNTWNSILIKLFHYFACSFHTTIIIVLILLIFLVLLFSIKLISTKNCSLKRSLSHSPFILIRTYIKFETENVEFQLKTTNRLVVKFNFEKWRIRNESAGE